MTTAREPGVTITLGRIYQKLLDVERISKDTKIHVADIRGDVDSQGNRITVLERRVWPLPSLAVLVAVGSLAVTFLKN